MHHSNPSRLPKWPFIAADLTFLAAACYFCKQSHLPLEHWDQAVIVVCVVGGALCGLAPFVLEYQAAVRIAETDSLTTAIAQIQRVEHLAAQISGATAQWQTAHEEAGKTAATARELSERMAAEMRGFTEFMERANNNEKASLRLEVEKLRRGEGDWLQVLVRILDHTHALHQGGLRSGLPNLIEQLSRFQAACCDAARRVGLIPFIPADSEPFDPQRHQLLEGESTPPADAVVAETLATGFTFQGRLLRPALVRLRPNQVDAASPTPASGPPPPAQASDASQADHSGVAPTPDLC